MAQQNLKTDLTKLGEFANAVHDAQTRLDDGVVKQLTAGLRGTSPYPDFGKLPEAQEMGSAYAAACGEVTSALGTLSQVLGDLQDSVKQIHQMYANSDQSVQMSVDAIQRALSGLDKAFTPPTS